jgi:hypothetical protein
MAGWYLSTGTVRVQFVRVQIVKTMNSTFAIVFNNLLYCTLTRMYVYVYVYV